MLLVGETMPRVFKGETTMLEHFRSSGLLDEYYAHGFGTMQSSLWLSQAVKQITDRHPHLNLLEIGESDLFYFGAVPCSRVISLSLRFANGGIRGRYWWCY